LAVESWRSHPEGGGGGEGGVCQGRYPGVETSERVPWEKKNPLSFTSNDPSRPNELWPMCSSLLAEDEERGRGRGRGSEREGKREGERGSASLTGEKERGKSSPSLQALSHICVRFSNFLI